MHDPQPRLSLPLVSALLALALVGLPGAVLAQDDAEAVAQPGGTLPGEPAIELVQVASGLIDPVNVAAPDDGSGRLFVVERTGTIRVIEEDGSLREEPFLDISNTVKISFLEQGLLGLAFAPDFADSGEFYVYYIDERTNGNQRIVRYSVADGEPQVADPDSASLVLEIPDDPYFNHNGGNLSFGPDGFLYWSTGDGGSAGDPFDNAQDRSNLYGILGRIDVSAAARESGHPYAIPEDNPFAQSSRVALSVDDPANYHPDARAEIWAFGLRNPWEFEFDRATGDLYIADVGQGTWEEINFAAADAGGGQNYGWDFLEGSHCYPAEIETCPRQQVGVLPVAEYDHEDGDCSITGLGVHRGETSAALDGIYFVSDYCSGRIWGLARDDGGTWQFAELLDTTLLVAGGGNDIAGNVYLTHCGCAFGRDYDPFEDPSGSVWRIVSADEVPEDATTAPLQGAADPEAEEDGEGEEPSPSPIPEPSPAPDESPASTPQASPDSSPDSSPEASPGDPDASPQPTSEATDEPSEPTAEPTSAASGEPTSEPSQAASPEATAEGDVTEITLVAAEVAFSEEELSVEAGAQVRLTLRNEDPVEHNFALYETPEAEESIFVGEIFSGPDSERVYEFEAPSEPGEYFFRCDPHPELMTGTFIVT